MNELVGLLWLVAGLAGLLWPLLSPYFGPRLSRQVSLVSRRSKEVPGEADWLLVSPSASVRKCRGSWQPELILAEGWRIERRVAPDACLDR